MKNDLKKKFCGKRNHEFSEKKEISDQDLTLKGLEQNESEAANALLSLRILSSRR